MVAPTSAFWEVLRNNIGDKGSYYIYRERMRQAKPYNLVLPFHARYVHTADFKRYGQWVGVTDLANANSSKSPWWIYASKDLWDVEYATERNQAINLARSKFSSRLGEEAGWLINLMQRKQAMDMIASSTLRIARCMLALRRFQFGNALRALQVDETTPKAKKALAGWRRKNRAFASNFLMLHFGWEPLVKDIGASIELLESPIPDGEVSVNSKRVAINRSGYRLITGPPFNEYQKGTLEGYVLARMGARVRVTNPNLYLSSRLGLTNLGAALWDGVPWSFVVDWWFNVGQWLSQWTEFAGIELLDPYTTTLTRVNGFGEYRWTQYGTIHGWDVKSTSSFTNRVSGISGVTLGMRAPWRLSATRAVTMVSLLIQKGIRAKP